jgi:hypothetical protein
MFEDGASPEEIVEQYGTLQLDDVYAVITYLPRNRDEVNAYLSRRGAGGGQMRQAIDEEFPAMLRSKLLKAKREREAIEG